MNIFKRKIQIHTSKFAPRLRNLVPAYRLLLLAIIVMYIDLPKMLTFDWPMNP